MSAPLHAPRQRADLKLKHSQQLDSKPNFELLSRPFSSTSNSSSSFLRKKIFREVKFRAAPTSVPKPRGHPSITPVVINAELSEELAHVSASDEYRQLAAHRTAFDKFLETQDDSSRQLLARILQFYEKAEFHRFREQYLELASKLTVAEKTRKEAVDELTTQKRALDALRLEVDNLRRQLNQRNELISHISSTHKINLSGVNWITGVDSKVGRTMAEIRTIQKRVVAAYGEAQQRSVKEDGELISEKETELEDMKREMMHAETLLQHKKHGIPRTGEAEVKTLASAQQFPLSERKSSPTCNLETTADQYLHCQRVDNLSVNLDV